jgi:hypothetical protein
MSRHAYAPRPRCTHTQAAYDDYQARDAAHYTAHPYDLAGAPKEPEGIDGYCAVCHRALWQPGAIWPADVWAFFNAEAANGFTGSKPLKPYRLPGAPKPRREPLEKLYARARAAYAPPKPDGDYATAARVQAAIGTRCGDEHSRPWYIDTTNGHTALIRPGTGTKAQSIRLVGDYGAEWIDLPEDLYLALQRVRIFANDRSQAIKLSIVHGGAKLSASSCELGEASETIIPAGESGRLTEYETCLNAEYLDACLGSWPLRWYLRPPVEHDEPARWIEELPQVFQPAGAEWRAVIMPMRI